MSSSLLNIGLSGLMTSQRGLSTTAHNVANSNTDGYSRQRVELSARPPQYFGGLYNGTGVSVADITRSYDQLLTREVQLNTSSAAEYDTRHELAAQLDSLLGTSESGLSEPLQSFFNAIEDAAADPSSVTARQLMLDEGDHLAYRFQSLGDRLDRLGTDVKSQAEVVVGEINDLATSIASLNERLTATQGMVGESNDLLDQRDELVRQLSERVSVTTVTQDDGATNVYIGSGQSLVMGGEAREVSVIRPDVSPEGIGIALSQSGGVGVEVTSEMRGGSLGALVDFSNGMLSDAERRLGQIALGVAEQFNTQHELGMDLKGELGGPLFTDINAPELQTARATADTSNTGTAVFEISVTSAGDLQDSDYRLSYDASGYTLVRQSDNKVIGTYGSLPQTIAGEGLQIELQSGSPAPSAGDQFTLRPAASALQQFEVAISDPSRLALASPVRSAITPGNLGDASIGSATFSNPDASASPLSGAITLTYDSGQINISGAPAGTTPTSIAYDPSADSGEDLTLSVAGLGDISFAISGAPHNGDSFTLESNAGGSGDNSNALLLSDLGEKGVLAGGSATIADGYDAMVGQIASRTSQYERASETQTALLQRAEDSRAAYSGVNLDEEAANIMRYQQAYQPSARVVSVANEMFDTLLRAFGG